MIPAGRVLGVGLVCFGLWLLVDGRQLYNAAVSGQLGIRRDVAMAILKPIARLDEALSLDRIVNGVNRAIGREGAPGSGSSGPTTPVVTVPTTVPNTIPTRYSLGAPIPALLGPPFVSSGWQPGRLVAGGTTPGGTTPGGTSPGALAQPSAAHPITVLQIGDSLGEDLGSGLIDVLGSHKDVKLYPVAVGDTGLANVAYYNWAATLETDLAAYHPEIVIAMFGGNDSQPFYFGARNAIPGTPFFRTAYGARVAQIMHEATAAGARLFWVGMPIMASADFSSRMAELNSIVQAEAATHPGVTYFSSWKLFENAAGQYSTYLPDSSGNLVTVRDPDGVHIAPPAGDDLLANAVVASMSALYKIRF